MYIINSRPVNTLKVPRLVKTLALLLLFKQIDIINLKDGQNQFAREILECNCRLYSYKLSLDPKTHQN
jgi:hypothetical protein